jgi:hypothetical protein
MFQHTHSFGGRGLWSERKTPLGELEREGFRFFRGLLFAFAIEAGVAAFLCLAIYLVRLAKTS